MTPDRFNAIATQTAPHRGTIEEGAAFDGHGRPRRRRSGAGAGRRVNRRRRRGAPERFDVIVIGAGQAGLSVGYHLARRGLPFVILDANDRIGDAWRQRWDSLRLFTPARYDGLDGMPFPGARPLLPDQGRDGRLPRGLRGALRAAGAERRPGRPAVDGAAARIRRRGRRPPLRGGRGGRRDGELPDRRVPGFAGELDPDIVQIHSSDYRNPAQLAATARVLIVGAGNSGAEIARELARRGRKVVIVRPRSRATSRSASSGFVARNVLRPHPASGSSSTAC